VRSLSPWPDDRTLERLDTALVGRPGPEDTTLKKALAD
jgi:hypothetical protein